MYVEREDGPRIKHWGARSSIKRQEKQGHREEQGEIASEVGIKTGN